MSIFVESFKAQKGQKCLKLTKISEILCFSFTRLRKRSTPKDWSCKWNLRIWFHTNTMTIKFLWIRSLGTYLLNSNSQNLHEIKVFWQGPYILIFKPPGENIKHLWQHGSQSLRNKISWFCHVWNLSNQKSIWGGR